MVGQIAYGSRDIAAVGGRALCVRHVYSRRMTALSQSELSLFRGVASAAFANPFGEARERIDAELAGTDRGADRDAVVDALLERVGRLIAVNADLDVREVSAEHRRAVELTLLFHVFHLSRMPQRTPSGAPDSLQAPGGA